jgi:hypothetical protein
MTFTTTFAFTVGRVDFEPGTYVVRPIDDQPNMVCVQGKHGGPAAIVMGVAENPRHKSQVSRVTFVREGNRLVMKSLWEGPESEGLDILPSVVTVNAD